MNHLIAFWNNRRTRGYIYQAILGLLFALLLVFISVNTSRNLDDLGKSFGMNPLCIFKDLGFNVYEGQMAPIILGLQRCRPLYPGRSVAWHL